MKSKNKHKSLTLVLVFMIFVFQNAWASQQTYFMACNFGSGKMQMQSVMDCSQKTVAQLDSTQTCLNLNYNSDKNKQDNKKGTMNHEQCADCCQVTSTFVTHLYSVASNHLTANKFSRQFALDTFYSISSQPLLPPPID